MESMFSRMMDIGKSELLLGRIIPPEEVLNKIEKVQMEDIERVILKVFDNHKYNIAYIGNIPDNEKTDEKLKEIFFS